MKSDLYMQVNGHVIHGESMELPGYDDGSYKVYCRGKVVAMVKGKEAFWKLAFEDGLKETLEKV